MEILATNVRLDSDEYRANRTKMQALVAELRERTERAREGGGAKYVERHRAQGKLPVRERVAQLIDPNSPFLELSPLAAWELYDNDAPAAGIVTGIGRVNGREVMIVANDATVKGGTYYPLTVKKHVRAQEIALRESPAVRLSRRFGRRVSAASGRGLSRSRPLRPDFLQPGADVGRAHSRKLPSSWGRAPRAAPTCRRCPMKPSSSRAPARSSSAARRSSKPRPAKKSPPKNLAAPTSTPASAASPTTSPKTTSTRSRSHGRSSRRSTRASICPPT